MNTLLVAAVTLLGGAVIGYLVRLFEFRRDQRLEVYGAFIGSFLDAAHSGAALFSLHMQMGDKIFHQDNRDQVAPSWETWAKAAERFEVATAKLRLVASEGVRAKSEELEDFISLNVRAVPPLRATQGTQGWGDSAKVGLLRLTPTR